MAPLASREELRTHLQNTTITDALADLALAGASGVVRSYCGWDLLREDTTFTVDGDGSVVLSLPTMYLDDVTEIRVDGADLNDADPRPIWTRRGQIYWASYWPARSKVEVDAVHGYTIAPDVVRLVTLTLAAAIITNPDGAKTASVGSVRRSYDPALTELHMRLLDPYRI